MEAVAPRVLVTGITGFLGSQVCFECLSRNYLVRGTVRSKKDPKKLAFVEKLPNKEKLEIVEADLSKDEGWAEATKDCKYVIHVASPFPMLSPKNENDIILPAVQGTMRVIKAAKLNNVQKIIITSSVAAIDTYNKADKVLTEDHWSNLAKVNTYCKSKHLAEKEAWTFYNSQDPNNKMEMSVINPGFILGPSLIGTDFTSGEIILKLLVNDLFGIPKVHWGIVDVRDCAIAHVNAIDNPESNGKRFICVSEGLWMEEIIKILREKYQPLGYTLPSHKVWKSTLWIASIFSKEAEEIYPMWNLAPQYDNQRSIKILGVKYRSAKDAVLGMAESLIKFGIVPDKSKK